MEYNLTRLIVCPFCKRQNVANAWVNVLCPCGAKFYIHNNEFWDRKDGRIVKNPPFELVEKEM